MEMWYDKNNDIENLRKEDFMRKKIYGIATALTLAMGCSLFMTYPVQAAETQIFQQDSEGNYILPDGNIFQSVKTLKNGKTIKYYDVEPYGDGDYNGFLKGKILYDGEEFQFEQYYTETGYCDIENPGYNISDKSTQKFRTHENPETYFPALTATKKVNNLINKYEAPSARMLPKYVDKTSKVYKEMETAAKEATKNCKTDYEKITTITDYVHSVMTYDISKSHVVWSMEDAWNTKTGVCDQYSQIMERMMQILGIPSFQVAGKNHACTLSYDKDSKKWIFSDPTNGIKDWNPYTRAGNADVVIENIGYLKLNNAYYCINFDRKNPENGMDYDNWDFPEKWGVELHDWDYTKGTDIIINDTALEGIPFTAISEKAFFNDKQLTSLSLPSSVERVDSLAFEGASNLKTITFSDGGKGLKMIDRLAFKDCSS